MKDKKWTFKLGLGFLIFSIFLFLSLALIPFLSFDNKTKITLTSIVFFTAEICFYGGGFLLGKELFVKYKNQLNPKNWFKTKSRTKD